MDGKVGVETATSTAQSASVSTKLDRISLANSNRQQKQDSAMAAKAAELQGSFDLVCITAAAGCAV